MKTIKSGVGAVLATAALATALSFAGPGTANASTPGHTAKASGEQSCWVDAQSGQSVCVALGQDLVAAVERQTDKIVVAHAGMKVGGVAVTKAEAALYALSIKSSAASSIVSEVFDDINYGGGNLEISSDSCTGAISSLVDYGWNDRVSSFKSFGGCETALYQNINYGGTRFGYYANKASLTGFNDEASSWRTR